MTDPADRRQTERRRGDRRRSDRRQASPLPPQAAATTPVRDDPSTLTAALGGEFDAADSSVLAREARRVAHAPGGALARIVRTYAAARAAVGMALLGALVAAGGVGGSPSKTVAWISTLYALQAALLWLVPSLREWTSPRGFAYLRRRDWVATIGVDLVAFGLLHVLDAGASFNYAALLVLPVLMSGVLTSRVLSLGTAAGVALLLLAVTLRTTGAAPEGAAVLAQSGLAGMGLFVIALMGAEMAARMARDELAARGSLEIARQQAQLNRLVIEEMVDGVLVVDRRLRVRAANPAARQLLVPHGLAPVPPFALPDLPDLGPLCAAAQQAIAEENWPEAGREVQLSLGDSARRTLRVRVRFTRGQGLPEPAGGAIDGGGMGEGLCVMLLEDARTVQARLRQEKLAAMGRVSAGIAHEFRNPLAAIAQANALLLEEPLDPHLRRLGSLVADNVGRLRRIVDDVLELSSSGGVQVGAVDAREVVRLAVGEWAQTAGVLVGDDGNVRLELPAAALGVAFDAEHLRRVLVNLLDNALRHGTGQRHSIVVRLAPRDEEEAVIVVASDGEPIAADVERHLFEPFFSTRSRGSGLGLYICRELCERYGASIEFRARARHDHHRNSFVVLMRRRGLPGLQDGAGRADDATGASSPRDSAPNHDA